MWVDFNTHTVTGLNVLVLFDGAGFAARGLLDSGITANGGSMTCVEIDPARAYLSRILNPEARHIVSDIFDLPPAWVAGFDAVWASPPCQKRSGKNGNRDVETIQKYDRHDDMLQWSLALSNRILWVENVIDWNHGGNEWGVMYNAAQFEERPRQQRQRLIGGRYRPPATYRRFRRDYSYDGLRLCPAIVGHNNRILLDKLPPSGFVPNEAVNFYGRPLSVRGAAWHQGLDDIPGGLLSHWFYMPPEFDFPLEPERSFNTWAKWRDFIYQAIGNAVPVYMARAFGAAYSEGAVDPLAARQLSLF